MGWRIRAPGFARHGRAGQLDINGVGSSPAGRDDFSNAKVDNVIPHGAIIQ